MSLRKIKNLFLCVILILICLTPNNHIHMSIIVNSSSAENIISSQIASLGSNGFIVIWITSTNNVRGQIFDSNKNKKGSELTIVVNGSASKISVSESFNGFFYVAFNVYNLLDGYTYIFKYDLEGIAKSYNFINTNYDVLMNSLSISSDGKILLVSSGRTTSEYFLYNENFQQIKASCTSCNFNDKNRSDAAGLINSKFIIVWDEFDNFSQWNVMGMIITSSGDFIIQPFIMNSIINNNQFNSRVTALTNGGFAIVFESNISGSYQVYSRIFDEYGDPKSNDFKVNDNEKNIFREPSIAGLSSGGFIIVFPNYILYENDMDIYSKEYNSSGIGISNEVLLCTYTQGIQNLPIIKSTTIEKYAIVYLSESNYVRLDFASDFSPLKCNDFTQNLKVGLSSANINPNLDFPGNVGYNSSIINSVSIKIKSFPIFGKLQSSIDQSNLILDTQYENSIIKYIPGTITPITFNYCSFDPSYGESNVCTVTLNVCFYSCNRCIQVGDSTDHKCLACESGYYPLENNSNICHLSTSTISEYYFSQISNNFRKCPTYCNTCTNSTTCLVCNNNYYLYTLDSTCYVNCPNGSFNDNITRTCSFCFNGCASCTNNSECTICQNTYYLHYLFDNKCYQICPTKYYGNRTSKKCESCIANCLDCTNNLLCSVCDDSYYLDYLNDKKCLATCRPGYYPDLTTKNCEPCPRFYYDGTNTCLDQCPLSYFPEGIKGRCLKCSNNCDECSNSTECIMCSENFFNFDKEECKNTLPKYYGNIITRKWSSCTDFCEICNNSSECIRCLNNYYFLPNKILKCGLCPNELFYPDNTTKKCESCPNNCKICQNQFECMECLPDNYFLPDNPKNCGICPQGFYGDSITKKCELCPNNCKICQNQFECMECLSNNFYLPDNPKNCGTCPKGFYGDTITKICEKCPIDCDVCTSNSECETCSSGYYILDKLCYKTCPPKYYINKATSSCSKCKSVCVTCQNNSDYCIECASDNFTYTNLVPVDGIFKQCLKSCPNGYYPDDQKECKTCKEQGKFRMDNKCLNICDKGYYKNTEISECVSCNRENEFIFKDTCVLKCPDNLISDNYRNCITLECQDQCKNGGECYIEENQIKCKCSSFYSGNFCEIELTITADKIDIEEPVSTKTLQLLDDIRTNLVNDPSKVTPEITNKITDLALKQVELVNSGIIAPSTEILNVFSTALTLNTITNSDEPQMAIDNLKNNMSKLLDNLVASVDLAEPKSIKHPEFSVQIMSADPEAMKNINEMAIINKISIVDTTECESALKKEYGISEKMSLIIKKIDFNSSLNMTALNDTTRENSDSIVYEYFDPMSKKKLNLDPCKNITIKVKAANTKATSKINITSYSKLSSSGLDMLNPNSPAYHSRCVRITDPKTGKDATVKFRANNYYQNKSAECAPNCNYEGLDENGYVVCGCVGMMQSEQKANSMVKKDLTLEMPHMNLDIVFCYKEVLKYPDVFYNSGFFICGFFLIFAWVYYAIARNNGDKLIENHLNEIIDYDCVFFNSEDMDVKEYFEYQKNKNRKKDSEIYRKIRDNIENINQSENNKNGLVDSKISIGNLKKTKKPKKVAVPKDIKLSNESSLSNSNPNLQHEIPIGIQIINKNFKKSIKWKSKLKKKYVSSTEKKNFEKNPSPIEDIKMYRNRPYKIGVYFKFPDHMPTIKDFECLSPYVAVTCDNRTFLTLLFYFLVDEHDIFSLIYRKSLMDPQWIEVNSLCFTLSILFAMNALFFTDEYIDKKFEQNSDDGFFISFTSELPKTILSLVFTIIITTFADLFVSVPAKVEEEFNQALKTKNKHAIRVGYKIFLEKMQLRYYLYMIVTTLLNIFFWYYAITFCGIYVASSPSWLYGSFSGILLDWLFISLSIPVVKSLLRVIIRRYTNLRFLISIEYFIWLCKNFCG